MLLIEQGPIYFYPFLKEIDNFNIYIDTFEYFLKSMTVNIYVNKSYTLNTQSYHITCQKYSRIWTLEEGSWKPVAFLGQILPHLHRNFRQLNHTVIPLYVLKKFRNINSKGRLLETSGSFGQILPQPYRNFRRLNHKVIPLSVDLCR